MLKFKKDGNGGYIANSPQGLISIEKNDKNDKKWRVSYPTGKRQYAISYSAAKDKAELWLAQNPKQQPKQQPTAVKLTLKDKLKQDRAYVTGVEPIGCINSGVNACILHIKINNKSHYLVGREADITDTLFANNVNKIRRLILSGTTVEKFYCDNNQTILVTTSFKKAEKAYQERNVVIINKNYQARQEIARAQKALNNGVISNESAAAAFAIADYGLF